MTRLLLVFRTAAILASRDLKMMARRRRTYVVRTLFAGSLFLLLDILWATEGTGRKLESVASMAAFGQGLFMSLGALGAILAAVLAPAYTAGAIAEEKERGSMDVIRTTQIGSAELVLGKWACRILPILILLASGLPLLAACTLFGGVGPRHVLVMGINLIGIAVLGASVGLLCSVVFARTYQALIAAYLSLGIFAFLPVFGGHIDLFANVMIGTSFRTFPGYDASAWWFYHPTVNLMVFLREIRASTGLVREWAGLEAVPFYFVASFACLFMAIWLFPRWLEAAPPAPGRKLFGAMDRFFERCNRGLWSVSLDADRLEGNPVAWKERHFRLTGRTDYLIRAGWVALAVFGIIEVAFISHFLQLPIAATEYTRHDLVHVRMLGAIPEGERVMAGLTILAYLVLGTLAAFSIAREKDRGTWESILTTPLSGSAILMGKMRGTLRASYLLLTLPLAHFFVLQILWNSSRVAESHLLRWVGPFLLGALMQAALAWWGWRTSRNLFVAMATIIVSSLLFLWVFMPASALPEPLLSVLSLLGVAQFLPENPLSSSQPVLILLTPSVQVGACVLLWYVTGSAFMSLASAVMGGAFFVSWLFLPSAFNSSEFLVAFPGGCLFALTLGTFFSLRSKTTIQALTWTLSMGLAKTLLVGRAIMFMSRESFPDTLDMAIIGKIPFLSVIFDVEAACRAAIIAFDYVVSGLLFVWMVIRFDRLVGRSPQGAGRRVEISTSNPSTSG
ncbi:MAG: ABC transporter permease subunit [Planctomycetes bacterium]|nr:ABC transporter permease subunit [Planctomycetota bacterium]